MLTCWQLRAMIRKAKLTIANDQDEFRHLTAVAVSAPCSPQWPF
jgi:uncharacterized membrane-anchored protein